MRPSDRSEAELVPLALPLKSSIDEVDPELSRLDRTGCLGSPIEAPSISPLVDLMSSDRSIPSVVHSLVSGHVSPVNPKEFWLICSVITPFVGEAV